jgi:hypothetical protein
MSLLGAGEDSPGPGSPRTYAVNPLGPVRDAFGRGDWLANGLLFAAYHLHAPWVIPTALLDTFALAYPSRRYRSALIGIAVHSVHSVQSLVLLALALFLVLA